MIAPKPLFQSKPKRLKRRAVTIAAGFKGIDGVVLCADTQETIGEVSKRNVPKLRFEPSSKHLFATQRTLAGLPDMAVAFCGATNSGPFIDKIVDRAWTVAQEAASLAEACDAIEQSIKSTYTEFGQIYQSGYCPEAELIYGVKMEGDSKLFHALGPVVNEREGYASAGTGFYMADFLASRLYSESLTIKQLTIIAAYVLFQAKEHVPDCGGDSHIAILGDEGQSGMVPTNRVKTITDIVQAADSEIGKLIIPIAEFDTHKRDVLDEATTKLGYLLDWRDKQVESLQYWEDFWNKLYKDSENYFVGEVDETTPSNVQRSKDSQ